MRPPAIWALKRTGTLDIVLAVTVFNSILEAIEQDVDLPTLAQVMIDIASATNAEKAQRLTEQTPIEKRSMVRTVLLQAEHTLEYEWKRYQRGERSAINKAVPAALEEVRAYRIRHYEAS